MQGFGGFSVHGISFPIFDIFFFNMALFPFNQKKKGKGQQQTYGCDREVVYAIASGLKGGGGGGGGLLHCISSV